MITLYDHWATIRDAESSARKSLKYVADTQTTKSGISPSVREGVTDGDRRQLRAQAKRTAAECLALVAAIDAKLGIEDA